MTIDRILSLFKVVSMIFLRQTRREAHADAVAAATVQKQVEARSAITELLLEITTTINQKQQERISDDKKHSV